MQHHITRFSKGILACSTGCCMPAGIPAGFLVLAAGSSWRQPDCMPAKSPSSAFSEPVLLYIVFAVPSETIIAVVSQPDAIPIHMYTLAHRALQFPPVLQHVGRMVSQPRAHMQHFKRSESATDCVNYRRSLAKACLDDFCPSLVREDLARGMPSTLATAKSSRSRMYVNACRCGM